MTDSQVFIVAVILNNLFWMGFIVMLINSLPKVPGQSRMTLPKLPFTPAQPKGAGRPYSDVTDSDLDVNKVLESVQRANAANLENNG